MAASLPEETIRLYKNVMDDVVRALREDLKAQSRFEAPEIEHKLALLRQRWRDKLLAQGVDLDAVFVPTAGGSMTAPQAAPKRRPAVMVTDEGKRKRHKVVKPRATPFLPANGLEEDGSIAAPDDEDEDDEGTLPISTPTTAGGGVGVSLDTRVPSGGVAANRAVPAAGQMVNPFTQTVRAPSALAGAQLAVSGPPQALQHQSVHPIQLHHHRRRQWHHRQLRDDQLHPHHHNLMVLVMSRRRKVVQHQAKPKVKVKVKERVKPQRKMSKVRTLMMKKRV